MKKIIIILFTILYPTIGYTQNLAGMEMHVGSSITGTYTSVYPLLMLIAPGANGLECGYDLNRPYTYFENKAVEGNLNSNMSEIPGCSGAEDTVGNNTNPADQSVIDSAYITANYLTTGTYILTLFASPVSQPTGYWLEGSIDNANGTDISPPKIQGYIGSGGVDTYTFDFYPTMTTAPVITKQVTLDSVLSTIQGAFGAACIKTNAVENDLTSRINQAQTDQDAGDTPGAIAVMDGYISAVNAGQSQGTIGSPCSTVLVSDAQSLKESLQQGYVPPPPPPKLTLTPAKATLPLGAYYTMTATLTQGDTPVSGSLITVGVISGPNQGLVLQGNRTDSSGQTILRYTSKITGTDYLVAYAMAGRLSWDQPVGKEIKLALNMLIQPDIPFALVGQPGSEGVASVPVQVTWSGGPDLAVDYFYPQFIRAKAGDTITLEDITGNYGNVAAGPSITRYYITQGLEISPATDQSLGQRPIPTLSPQQTSKGGLEVTLPTSLTDTTYHLYACADADNQVVETNETNNCQRNRLVGYFIPAPGSVAMQSIATYCRSAKAKVTITGHKDKRVATVTIIGVNAPTVIIYVIRLRHGKPTKIKGSYVSGVGTPTVQIKLKNEEQCGGEKNCDYVIGYFRNDSQGGICGGTVTVNLCKKKHEKEHEDKNYKKEKDRSVHHEERDEN